MTEGIPTNERGGEMKALILAAGKGSRISADIEAVPKSTLCINNKPIIRGTVECLLDLGVEVAVCVGYKRQKIYEALEGCSVEFFYNPFYSVTNNIASLWMAQQALDQEFMVVSADLIFHPSIPQRLMEMGQGIAFAADSSRVAEGDYFFHLNARGEIDEFGPSIPVDRRDCENMGMLLVREDHRELFVKRLNELVDNGRYDIYYEQIALSYIGEPDVHLRTVDMKGLLWREIDYIEDYKKALSQFEIR